MEGPFVRCPVCGDPARAALVADWQRRVNEERMAIPIVGCGNPWHYVDADAPHAARPQEAVA